MNRSNPSVLLIGTVGRLLCVALFASGDLVAGGGGQTGATLTGYVKDSGFAVQGAAVVVDQQPAKTATTNKSGAYSISGVSAGTVTVTASKSGYFPSKSGNITVPTSGTITVPDLNIGRAGTVTGTVQNPIDHTPVQGVTVSLYLTSYSGVTDSTGKFSFPAAAGGYSRVSLSKPGWLSYTTEIGSFEVVIGQTTTIGPLFITQLGTILGVVKDSSTGAGIGGATVSQEYYYPTVAATTAPDGSFSFQCGPGSQKLILNATGYQRKTTASYTVTGGATTNTGTITLDKGTTVDSPLTQNTTFTPSGNPYVVTNDLEVAGAILAIQSGVNLFFPAYGRLLLDSGATLSAVGTPTNPITFTSSAPSPTPGAWGGITFRSGSSSASQISYATVSYATTAIALADSSPTLDHVTVANTQTTMLDLTGTTSAPIVTNSSFMGTAQAVKALAPLAPNTTLNYWGAANGPNAGSGTGSGGLVSAVVSYDPWLTAPPTGSHWIASSSVSGRLVQPSLNLKATINFTLNAAGNWKVTIRDAANNIVRTYMGSGSSGSVQWDGTNDVAVLQPEGRFTFLIESTAVSGGQVAVSASGRLTLETAIATIASPSSGSTLSNVYQNGSSVVSVTGTATDPDIVSWALDVAPGTNPMNPVWANISSGSQSITNGSLGPWNTASVANGPYTLRLTVTDATAQKTVATATCTVSNFGVSVNGNPLQVSLASGGPTFTSLIPFAGTETLTLRDLNGTIQRVLVNAPRTTGTFADVWNDLTDAGTRAHDGLYTWTASFTDGTHSMTIDLSGQKYTDYDHLGDNVYSAFDPFNNQPLRFSVSLSKPGYVVLALTPSGNSGQWYFPSCNAPNFCLVLDDYQGSDTNSFEWAGLDDTGHPRTDINGVVVISDRTQMPINGFVLYGGKPKVTGVTVTPAVFSPAAGTQSIAFDLTTYQSQAVTVTVTLTNQGSMSILRTLVFTNVSPGHVVRSWDGRADNGMLVAPGPYTVSVTATDSAGNHATGQILTTVQY